MSLSLSVALTVEVEELNVVCTGAECEAVDVDATGGAECDPVSASARASVLATAGACREHS